MEFVKNGICIKYFWSLSPKNWPKIYYTRIKGWGFAGVCDWMFQKSNCSFTTKSPHMLLLLQVTTMLGQQLSKEEVEEFMKEADVDGNGKLDYDEFVKMMLQQWPPTKMSSFWTFTNLQSKYIWTQNATKFRLVVRPNISNSSFIPTLKYSKLTLYQVKAEWKYVICTTKVARIEHILWWMI